MPPRKVQRLSRNQEQVNQVKPVEPKKEKEHSCTEKDIINSFKEIGLEELVKNADY